MKVKICRLKTNIREEWTAVIKEFHRAAVFFPVYKMHNGLGRRNYKILFLIYLS
jgi:hypothetical protein